MAQFRWGESAGRIPAFALALIFAVLIVVCLFRTCAHAQTSDALRTAGREHMLAGEYANAYAEFDRLIETHAAQAMAADFFNRGVAAEELLQRASTPELENVERAIADFERVLADFERAERNPPRGLSVSALRTRLGRLRTLRERLQHPPTPVPVPTPVPIVPVPQPTPPIPVVVPPTPVSPTPLVVTPPHPATPRFTTRVTYRRSAASRVGPWVTMASGLVLGGVGAAVFGALAADQASTYNAAASGNVPWSASATLAGEDADRFRTMALIAGAAGATVFTVGALWYGLRGRGERIETRVPIAVLPTGDGVAATLTGSF